MHGIIFCQLKEFVDANLGADGWKNLLKAAGSKRSVFLPIQSYPDEELVQLVVTASQVTGLPVPALLGSFGEFIAPYLIKTYALLIRPEWKTLDLLENTEETIHKVVRTRNPGALPPELKVARQSPTQALLEYGSERKLCQVAMGIIRGVARHYGDTITITEQACMHDGAPACQILITTP